MARTKALGALALLCSAAAAAGEAPFQGWSVAFGLGSETSGVGLRLERQVATPVSLSVGAGAFLPMLAGGAVAVRLHTPATRGAFLLGTAFGAPGPDPRGGFSLKLGWRIQGEGDYLDLAAGLCRARFRAPWEDPPSTWRWLADVTLAVGWNL